MLHWHSGDGNEGLAGKKAEHLIFMIQRHLATHCAGQYVWVHILRTWYWSWSFTAVIVIEEKLFIYINLL